ncbi:MAG TPA: zinc metallopeptidase [Saprospiraceae bacterium]|nr:zinc metallopeptidase [Saprospiraceae bacterium]
MGLSISYWVLIGAIALIGFLVQTQFRSKFKKYGMVGLSNGMTGAQVAASMLHHYGINDVSIVEGQGVLTDHYNPATKTVSLSPEVFRGHSIAAASVAAHECGHAVQHETQYAPLQLRSAIVPVVKIAAVAQQWGFLAAIMLAGSFPQLLLIVIIAMAITTLFSLITLPVEFDASRRALAWLDDTGTTRGMEYDYAKDSLKWAAMTYLVAALSAVAMLVYFILSYLGNRN